MISAYHAKYYAHELTRRHAADGIDRLSQSLFDASVDLNPHQIEAALFALRNPLQEGVLLADEVGLGKTIEASLVICQYWAERRRCLLVICPASLRKQWAQELHEKFAVPAVVVDAISLRKQAAGNILACLQSMVGKAVVIVSYQFAAKLEAELRAVLWDAVVIDEAHKLRNAHRASNRTGQALKRALDGRKKLLLTATPLQNSLMELYGLSTLIDEHLFGDEAAFRKQFMNSGADTDELRARLASFAKRTLRREVLEYIKYTERKALTQPFEPTDDEQSLYERISAFLQREDSYALPKRQRHLTALILRKLLASSSHAVAATLITIRERLERLLAGAMEGDGSQLVEQLIAEDDLEQDYLEEEASDDGEYSAGDAQSSTEKAEGGKLNPDAVRAEIAELTTFIDAAQALQTDTKAQALLKALTVGFGKMAELRAPRKAIIFTESKRTQEYLYRFLSAKGYAGKLVAFSGTNNHEDSAAIYQRWLEEFKGTDRVTGSPQVDRRTALIDHFRKDDGSGAEVMIATEAAAEGVNLQFCALIINYDLPWNPQRVEQRIGRCHRYGQRFDVVVINFLNTRNQADQRVLELLTEKFNLFSGVFGASDEVLGRIEGGLDFEKRILQIYDTCRQPEEIEAAFNALQAELEEVIADRIKDTQAQLLENFDEDVHDRLKLRLDETEARLDKLGRWFWNVTRFALNERARFDEQAYAFSLSHPPDDIAAYAPVGRYQLIRSTAQADMLAHAYRLSHPLGEWSIATSLNAPTPPATLKFDYGKHGARVSVIEKLRGKCGWLTLVRLEVTAFETTEALLFSGITDDGQMLDQEACEKLMTISAAAEPAAISDAGPRSLAANSQRLVEATIAGVLEANQRLFNEERDKLERWADDKLLAAEEALKNTKARIAQLKRDARKAATLQEQDGIQRELSELERKQRRLRQEIFAVEDEIIEKRDALIASLQQRMHEKTDTQTLFTLRWQVV
ncbi:DEAD/DEAH box helicase family protein [Burkholderia pseudomallei]|uniref:SNF2-related protein n=1 Tax=Burkholderia pseudomallei TaxID=28450 RepID=UPI0005313766|nr:SNF2-related protein [Burkholderia pseudomallei]KGS91819.1 DEAD/DEAH box helicase family protein [Burkholderia pseudomallei MSHR7498]KGU70909.1 DEAD/DEAH box helicase family protein [Burkholderia pseudomallei MSHR4304]KGV29912.1 DEAD/DEAH box helicase family protein [Burkholderia pseudomallei MSHR4308]KGX23660.1 DEAD/DEAH box helicase family protein [Burkholderia pseudomallei]KGX29336.1 DEAD/DEAH box helicase family protein [Burkholderia pseudomallei]